ncbi:CLASP N terminal-domain containing protein [Rhodotorula toruloides]|uniref:CLASP N terminal-domain containing protein n=1 Tax=Rhodotorula toruloides TaxID=5286 RepID=A0A2T0AIA2_RHOTO|nr:CLASP N terminal-domain containing protein [Rhodotorula toruloides]
MPKAPEPDKVPINSPADLRDEVDALLAVLQLNETEDTWEKINKALKRFQAVVRGGACRFTDEFVAAMRDPRMAKGVCRSLTTERGALSGTALEMVASCTRLGPSFAPLLAVYLPSVLRLFARPNKVYVTRAASTAASIIRNTRLGEVLRFIVLEWRNEGGKSASFREQAAAAVAVMLGCDTGSLAVEKDSLERRIEDLEWVIKTGAVGREVTVRADMKKCWEVYRREWPDRVASFTAPMTPTIRKYLKVDQMHTSAPSASSAHPAPPARKPNPPPPSATNHAPPPAPPASRPATLLSKSHGPPSSHAPVRHPLAASASTRPLPTASSSAAPIAAPLAILASSSLGMGAPPHRAARMDQPRSVSASASTSSSRSASRNEERDPLSASTSSLHSTVSSATHASRAGFKPTAPSKTAPLASRATRALAASTAAAANGMTTMAPPHEPRKARRVVQATPAVLPPTSSAAPTPAPAATTLARSQTSSTAPTPSATSRSHPPSTSSTAPVSAAPGSSHAPFRPKLTSSTVAAAALGATAAAKTRPVGTTARPAPPAPVVGDKQKDKENDKPHASAAVTASRPAAVTASAPAAAPAASTRTRPPRARSPEIARPKAVPSAATLASRERRAARERERRRGSGGRRRGRGRSRCRCLLKRRKRS